MTTRRGLRIALLSIVAAGGAVLGCIKEYHPEYRPELSYRYVQNVSYPTTIVQSVVAPPPPPAAQQRSPAPSAIAVAAPAERRASPTEPAPTASAETPPQTRNPTASRGVVAKPVGAELDAQLSASCLADDAEACRRLAALHVGQRRPGGATAAAVGNAFDRTVRGFGWRPVSATVAGSNGGAPGTGPRVTL
jgi:hypothetical protein